MKKENKIKRKNLIVFAYEGKNNKTENNYFHHFTPTNPDYILKGFSTGVTDPQNMINSIKSKRNSLDYNPKEDITFIFIDEDLDSKKVDAINKLKTKLPKDIHLVVSKPTFEIWFLNHFIKTTKNYSTKELLLDLNKYISNYEKNKDYFSCLKDKLDIAIDNSLFQLNSIQNNSSYTEVVNLFKNNTIKEMA